MLGILWGEKGIQPGDIWSCESTALLGVVVHYVDEEWELQKEVIGCEPFGNVRHTASEIRSKTELILNELDLRIPSVSSFVVDNGANMVSAWESLGTVQRCAAHTLELSVRKALECEDNEKENDCEVLSVQETLKKAKAVVNYFSRSTIGKNVLASSKEALGLPSRSLKQDVQTRWRSSYEMVCSLVESRDAIALYDVVNENKSSECSTFGENQLLPNDFDLLEALSKALKPCAFASQMLEGDKYATAGLVLPLLFRMIEQLENDSVSGEGEAHSKIREVSSVARRRIAQDIKQKILRMPKGTTVAY